MLQPRIAGSRFCRTPHTGGTPESHKSQQTERLLVSDSRSTSKPQAFDRDDTGARNPFQLRGTLELFSILK